MVKAYLRYELSSTFGVVTSNSALVHDNSGKFVVTAALENVAVWNIRQGTLVRPDHLLSESKETLVRYNLDMNSIGLKKQQIHWQSHIMLCVRRKAPNLLHSGDFNWRSVNRAA